MVVPIFSCASVGCTSVFKSFLGTFLVHLSVFRPQTRFPCFLRFIFFSAPGATQSSGGLRRENSRPDSDARILFRMGFSSSRTFAPPRRHFTKARRRPSPGRSPGEGRSRGALALAVRCHSDFPYRSLLVRRYRYSSFILSALHNWLYKVRCTVITGVCKCFVFEVDSGMF